MKKLLLLCILFAITVVSSCSSDDNNTPKKSKATATINGVEHVFNTFSVTEETFTDNDFTYTDVTITGSINGDPSKTFTVIVEKGIVGSDASYYFGYFLDQEAYLKSPSFATIVTESTDNHVKGSFSGTVIATDDPENILTLSNGSFDVYF